MALFSNKRYFKPGKGVEKDAPEKNAFFKFFELYGRKFWRFLQVNLITIVVMLPILMTIYAQVYDNMYYTFEDLGYTGSCASYEADNFTVTAKIPGASGNDYILDIDANKIGSYTVTLYTDRGAAAKDQDATIDTWFTLENISTVEELAAYENEHVVFEGSGPLSPLYDAQLSGGDGLMSLFTPLLYLTMLYFKNVPQVIQMVLLILSVLCFGPMKCGTTYVMRNYSRESHSWLSDIWDKAKENWKQGMLFGVIDWIIAGLIVFNMTFTPPDNLAMIMKVAKWLTLLLGMFYVFMRKYIYLMIVTVKLNLRSLITNAWLLGFIGIFRNFFSAFANGLIWILSYVLIMAVHPFMELVMIFLLIFSFTNFLSISACYPLVDKYLVQPIEEMQRAEAEKNTPEAGEEVPSVEPEAPAFETFPPRDTNLF